MKSCYGCEKRTPGCHATCEEYEADVQDNEIRKEMIRKGKHLDQDLNDREFERVKPRRKHHAK